MWCSCDDFEYSVLRSKDLYFAYHMWLFDSSVRRLVRISKGSDDNTCVVNNPHIPKFYSDSEGLGTKLQFFHDSIILQFLEESWAQRKPNQIQKNDQ